ncbi:hypothetical protein [Methanosarcina horonobensis]|uniref:hypothetical protein n=1 Tax=Methanosarcina horonobensis TaxID=418008 RepID=UPI000AB5B7DA|nr:hypothetical protein [Methanosarcina horonobensis]
MQTFFNNPLGLKIRKAWEARGFILRPEVRKADVPVMESTQASDLNGPAFFQKNLGFRRLLPLRR